MEEAQRVLARLARIEELRRGDAPATILLAEVRCLLAEGERWLAVEHDRGLEEARAALDHCRTRLERRSGVVAETAI
jgi:hypothetical protein